MVRSQQDLEREIMNRLDPEFDKTLQTLLPAFDSRIVRTLLRIIGVNPGDFLNPLRQIGALVSNAAESMIVFTKLGWAPSAQTPSAPYSEALRVLREGASFDEAEAILVRGWNDGDLLRWCIRRVLSLGAGEKDLGAIAHARARLIDKALEHHQDGRYEASVPIVLAQADGVVHDFGGVSLFSKRHPETPLEDSLTIAGMREGLRALRAVLAQDVTRSGSSGRLSRHGVMHGRELGYDTLTNSTKAFVLLIAVIEWAQPLAQSLAAQRQEEHEALHAGSDATNEHGQRLDNRGFSEARKALRWLSTCQMGQWRNRNGQYVSDLGQIGLADRGKDERPIHLRTATDGTWYYAWIQTPSGWCFGIAGKGGPPSVFLYADAEPPSGPPDDEPGWAGLNDDEPPDWRAI